MEKLITEQTIFEKYHFRDEKLLFMITLSFRITTYKLTNKNNSGSMVCIP